MERTATRTVQHTTRSTLLCCGLRKKAGGARNTITGRVASVWTRRRRVAEDALRVSFVWVSPAARTTYLEGERERAHERCANMRCSHTTARTMRACRQTTGTTHNARVQADDRHDVMTTNVRWSHTTARTLDARAHAGRRAARTCDARAHARRRAARTWDARAHARRRPARPRAA